MTNTNAFTQIIELAKEEYQQCANMPFAVFLLSVEGFFVKYNEAAKALFDLPENPDFIQNISDFYLFPNNRQKNFNRLYRLEKGQWLKDTSIDLKIGDDLIYVRDYTKAIWDDQNNKIAGLLCMVINITKGNRYTRLINDVPIGLFKILFDEEGHHVLVHCNAIYAQNHGAGNRSQLMGKDIRLLHKSIDAFEVYHNELIRRDGLGQSLLDYMVEAYNGKGELRKYEVYTKLLKDNNGQIIGRIGAERDVTDYLETKQLLEELTTDIGKVLHSYSSTLIHSKHTMDAVIRSSAAVGETSARPNQLNDDKILEKINHQIASLDQVMGKILEKNQSIQFFDEPTENQLTRILNLLKSQNKEQIKVQQLAIVRDGSIKIKEIIGDIAKGSFPRELIKQSKRHLGEILRLCSLITLSRGVDAILEMETVVNNLRSYILTPIKQKEKRTRLDIYDMLKGVVRNMEEYAVNRNVALRLDIRQLSRVFIDGYENELRRALLNILHNAIKYSWSRKGPAKAFVKISGRVDEQWLYLIVENWGVAITAKELENGLVFKVGYRGVNSRDRRRPGTGLGLYDTLKVIEKHQGQLSITSEPSLGNPADDYSNPFITSVKIQLPRNKPLSLQNVKKP